MTREQALRERIKYNAFMHAQPHYENDQSTWGAIDRSAFLAGANSLAPLLLELAEALQAIIRSDGMWAGNNDNERYSSFSSWNERKKDIASEAISSLDRFLSGGEGKDGSQ